MYEYLDRRYALALYEVAESRGKVKEYLDDLHSIVNLMNQDSEFLQILKHPQLSTSKKKEIITQLFKSKIDDELLSFLLVLIEKDRILLLEGKVKEFEKIYLEKNNTVIAEVKSVIPLDDEDRQNLTTKLENLYSKKIILKDEIDKSIIGGVYVKVGNDVIDGTVKSKLNEMKKLMLKRE